MFFAARFVPEGTPEQMRWFSDLQRITTTPEIAVRLRITSSEIDVEALAPLVRAPTLVLHGTGDAVAPFDQGRTVAALIPGARFVSLESRNHVLLESEPAFARFTEEVDRFLAAEAAAEHARRSLAARRSVIPAQPAPPPRASTRTRPRSR
jgi:pimeloyl-ACP methyl ester carboxylesterase